MSAAEGKLMPACSEVLHDSVNTVWADVRQMRQPEDNYSIMQQPIRV